MFIIDDNKETQSNQPLEEEFINFCSNPDNIGNTTKCFYYLNKNINLEYETQYTNIYSSFGPKTETALMRLIRVKNLPLIKILIDNQVDINHVRSSDGLSPLMLAAFVGAEEIVQLLINCEVDIDYFGEKGDVLHFWRIPNPQSQALKEIIQKKKNFNTIGEGSNHCLMKLIEVGLTLENLKIIHQKNGNIHAVNCFNHNLLLMAIYLNDFDIVKYLLEHNADLNQATKSESLNYRNIFTYLEEEGNLEMKAFIEKIELEKNLSSKNHKEDKILKL